MQPGGTWLGWCMTTAKKGFARSSLLPPGPIAQPKIGCGGRSVRSNSEQRVGGQAAGLGGGRRRPSRILVLGYRRAQRDQRPGRWPPEALAEGGRTIEDTCAWRSRPRRDRYQQQVMAGASSIGHSGLEGNHYQQTLMARCCAIG